MPELKWKLELWKMNAARLNKRFFTFHEKKRPYIILKWAQTHDGFIDIERTPENYGRTQPGLPEIWHCGWCIKSVPKKTQFWLAQKQPKKIILR